MKKRLLVPGVAQDVITVLHPIVEALHDLQDVPLDAPVEDDIRGEETLMDGLVHGCPSVEADARQALDVIQRTDDPGVVVLAFRFFLAQEKTSST